MFFNRDKAHQKQVDKLETKIAEQNTALRKLMKREAELLEVIKVLQVKEGE